MVRVVGGWVERGCQELMSCKIYAIKKEIARFVQQPL